VGVLGGLGQQFGAGTATTSVPYSRAASSDICAVDGIDPAGSQSLADWTTPQNASCTVRIKNGYALPDPKCTPGAVNPTLTLEVLQNKAFRTGACVRDLATSPQQKNLTYSWYGIAQPAGNIGKNQTCEKDHLISLELGGADTLDNLWPQCGPDGVPLPSRFFKEKDLVENYLAAMVRDGSIPLAQAQHGIAQDWTQYIDDAKKWYANGNAVRNDDQG
jgi:hypothetical protein